MCHSTPLRTKLIRDKICAYKFNKTYNELRQKGIPVTKSYKIAKNKTKQTRLGGKIIIHKWKGQTEKLTCSGKKLKYLRRKYDYYK